MIDRFRLGANLATSANAILGIGAIVYLAAGNPPWAMVLIVAGIGFDGLDGLLSRRSGAGPSVFGRVADSVADAITFGLAPAALLAFHPSDPGPWAGWGVVPLGIGIGYAVLAGARLVYFTGWAHDRADFLGVPTPQAALAVVLLALLFDAPGFLGRSPIVLVAGGSGLGVLMVVPIRFPKPRNAPILRPLTVLTGLLSVLALVPIQFHPPPSSPEYLLSAVAATLAAIGLGAVYATGPWVIRSRERRAAEPSP